MTRLSPLSRSIVALFASLSLVFSGIIATSPPAYAYSSSDCPDGWTFSSNKCTKTLTTSNGTSVTIPAAIATAGYTATLTGGGGGGGGSAYNGTYWDEISSGYAGGNGGTYNTPTMYALSLNFTIGFGGNGGGSASSGNCNSTRYSGSPGGSTSITSPDSFTAGGGAGGGINGGIYRSTQPVYNNGSSSPGGGGDGAIGCVGTTTIARNAGSGQNGQIVLYSATLAAPGQPAIGGISANASREITVTFSAVVAFPAVTRYDASCTSPDGGGTVTGNAASSPITVSNADPGKNYSCTVRAFNGSLGTVSQTSNTVLVPGAPWNNGGSDLPTFSGTVAYNIGAAEVLTGSQGNWNTPTGYPISGYAYLWQTQLDCSGGWSDAAGETKAQINYTIVAADVGNCLRLSVTATNFFGTSALVASSPSVQVTTLPFFTAQQPPAIADEGYFAGYTFAASGNRITYSVDSTSPLTGLPSGMDIDASSGALTGVPSSGTAGVYTYKIIATNDSGSVSTAEFTLTVSSGTLATIEMLTQPVGGPSGASLNTQPAVRLLDSSGRLVANPASVSATVNNSGTLGGADFATSPSSENGIAVFTSLTLAGLVNTDYRLTLTSGAISITTDTLRVTPGALHSITIAAEPVPAAAAGSRLSTQPVVELEDAEGNIINDRSLAVTVSSVLSSSTTSPGGSVGGTTTLATSTGIASFTDLTFGGTIGTLYKLKFSSGGVEALSNNISNSQAGAAAKLSVQTQPTLTSTEVVGDLFATQPVIEILDAGNNPTTATAAVTATPSGGTLGGTKSVFAISGTATFTDLDFAGLLSTNYRLTFTSPGLTSTTSATFQFSAGKFGTVSMAVTAITSSAQALPADGTTTTSVTVQVRDAGGNDLSSSQGLVTLSASAGTISAVVDVGDGTYTATYTPPISRGTGTATISGTLAGNPLTQTATIVLKSTQTVSFLQPSDVPLGALPFQISASASSGLGVTFQLGAGTTNGACTVSNAGLIVGLAVGDCEIEADQNGNFNYWQAPTVTRLFQIEATTPTAPYITSVIEGDTEVGVHFSVPGFNGGVSITNYEYSLDAGVTWSSFSPAVNVSPVTISGLVNGVVYSVQLRAVNSAGSGASSKASPTFSPTATVGGGATKTVLTTIPSAPRSPQVLEETSTSAAVSWKVPLSDGGDPITAYSVSASPSVSCTASLNSSAGIGTCTASSLTPGTTYTFTIRAENSNGFGASTTITYSVPGGVSSSNLPAGSSNTAANIGTGNGTLPSVNPGITAPVVTGVSGSAVVSNNDLVRLVGKNLMNIRVVWVDGVEATFFLNSDNLVTVRIPMRASAGQVDITFHGAFGSQSHSGLIEVKTSLQSIGKKETIGTFLGFAAVYTKNHEGKRLSMKIGTKWRVIESLQANYTYNFTKVGVGRTVTVMVYLDRKLVKVQQIKIQ